jgi:hypothetical protein
MLNILSGSYGITIGAPHYILFSWYSAEPATSIAAARLTL